MSFVCERPNFVSDRILSHVQRYKERVRDVLLEGQRLFPVPPSGTNADADRDGLLGSLATIQRHRALYEHFVNKYEWLLFDY